MAKKEWSDEERKAFGEKMKAARAKKEAAQQTTTSDPTVEAVTDSPDKQSLDAMQRQMNEIMETNALLKAALLNGQANQPQTSNHINIGGQGRLLGEVEKYLIDPSNYPDPTPRLRKEPRLAPLAFDYNYELEYEVAVSNYETKTGVNTKEPRFHITLNRIVLNDQGEQTDKRYIARRLVFHEDPQAALVIARQNNVDVDQSDEKVFLNEMRYLRVRDWLFDIFWPKPATTTGGIKEEVIGGQLVQVFTKSSEDPTGIDFDKLDKKMV